MPYAVTEFRDTPNPDALKCMVDRALPAVGSRVRSYRAASEVGEDGLAAALFAVPGVAGVLIHADWITVSRRDAAPWGPIKSGVTNVLRATL